MTVSQTALESVTGSARVPLSTYRLQFNSQFTFSQAAAILDYLQELGISDCYASPIFRAGPQSTHGYDVCQFDALNPTLGSTAQFETFVTGLGKRRMGLLLDMVPNHMGCDPCNGWWADVLANGRQSRFAHYFDIDWEPIDAELRDKVLLPVLEDHYDKVLGAGKLGVAFTDGAFQITYYDKHFPISRESSLELLGQAKTDLPFLKQPPVTLGQLVETVRTHAKTASAFGKAIGALLGHYNGQPGNPKSFEMLHTLLAAQHYRLAYWKSGLEKINYRRFFDVMGLVSLRIEDAEVFQAVHAFLFQMIQAGYVTGLRIDHPDGLWDPKAYFVRLQQQYGKLQPDHQPLFLVAEKILTGDEELPKDWPVCGTTGYEFLNRLNGLFVARENEGEYDRIYRAFTGEEKGFDAAAVEAKRTVLFTSFQSELTALAHRLATLPCPSGSRQGITFHNLREALAAIIIAFPVYRTYVNEETGAMAPEQRKAVEYAIAQARNLHPEVDSATFDFLAGVLLLEKHKDFHERGEAREFVLKFQQLTGPIMAKGLEDTAFYRFNRLISLNEVGGNPGRFGTTIDEFHRFNEQRLQQWPHSLLATATHDTKRGEDLRARINVLSELPFEWEKVVCGWRDLNASKKTKIGGQPAPDQNDEYLFYQTLIGGWPFASDKSTWLQFANRVREYMIKATREAKVRTNWIAPNTAYEEALTRFVDLCLQDEHGFVGSAREFQRKIAFFGRFNSLSQIALKLTCPGTPDIYQGTELWDLSLVDPDNRRPIDYSLRQKLLREVRELSASDMAVLVRDDPEGRLKLMILSRLLRLRHEQPLAFQKGTYLPLAVTGHGSNHVVAFARALDERNTVVVVPVRFCGILGGDPAPPVGRIWNDTVVEIPPWDTGTKFRNVLTKEVVFSRQAGNSRELSLRDTFAALPVAVLETVR